MIRQGRLVTLILISIGITSCGGASHTGWQKLPVPIYGDATIVSNPQAMTDLQDAFRYWEQKAGKPVFDFKGQWRGGAPYAGDPSRPSAILGNVIFFQSPWPFAQSFVGMTTVQTESDGIQAAMVMINGTQSFCPGDCIRDTRISARKTFAHELGHFIGLSHTENPNDIMFPDASPGGNINHLSVDVATLKILTGNE